MSVLDWPAGYIYRYIYTNFLVFNFIIPSLRIFLRTPMAGFIVISYIVQPGLVWRASPTQLHVNLCSEESHNPIYKMISKLSIQEVTCVAALGDIWGEVASPTPTLKILIMVRWWRLNPGHKHNSPWVWNSLPSSPLRLWYNRHCVIDINQYWTKI